MSYLNYNFCNEFFIENGHIFKSLKDPHCLICSFYKRIVYKHSCDKIRFISNTHKFDNFKCTICGIESFFRNGLSFVQFKNNYFYTCNEYLMIKANE